MNITTIAVSKDTVRKMKEQKVHRRETHDDQINRMIDKTKGELNPSEEGDASIYDNDTEEYEDD